MRGDRHWATARSHNKFKVKNKDRRALTQPQRRVRLYAIGNRGELAVSDRK